MKLTSVLGKKKITLSFEVFPPKADSDFESVRQAAYQVAKLQPDYMSVTTPSPLPRGYKKSTA